MTKNISIIDYDIGNTRVLSNQRAYSPSHLNEELDEGEPTTKTDSSGNYYFGNLVNGVYNIGVILPQGWGQTLPAGGSLISADSLNSEDSQKLHTGEIIIKQHISSDSQNFTSNLNEQNYHSAYQSIIKLNN